MGRALTKVGCLTYRTRAGSLVGELLPCVRGRGGGVRLEIFSLGQKEPHRYGNGDICLAHEERSNVLEAFQTIDYND